jgi:DNA polymerase-3 subunit beta
MPARRGLPDSLLLGEAGSLARLPDSPKGVRSIEQLNIEGKRSGSGFVTCKAVLVSALSRALAERVMLLDFTLGRKGLLGYLKALSGSNIIKVTPASGDAGETQVAGKRLRVVCGSNISHLEDMAWVGDKTPLTLCDVRVSPRNTVSPNLGGIELAEALSRVLPFTATEDNRPVLQCVLMRWKDGKLTLVSADGFRLAVESLDVDGDEGEVLIHRDELKGVINAIKRARRVRMALEANGDGTSLIVDTELIRYRWRGSEGSFPDYEKLIPDSFNASISIETGEALRAVGSLKALADDKGHAVDVIVGDGKVTLTSPDEKGSTEIAADTQGEVKIRVNGKYLAEALKACGGMAELKVVDGSSPMLFSSNGYKLVVMPMLTSDSRKAEVEQEAAEPESQPSAETAETTETEPEAEVKTEATENGETAEAVAEAEAITKTEKPKSKRKRDRKREPVAV